MDSPDVTSHYQFSCPFYKCLFLSGLCSVKFEFLMRSLWPAPICECFVYRISVKRSIHSCIFMNDCGDCFIRLFWVLNKYLISWKTQHVFDKFQLQSLPVSNTFETIIAPQTITGYLHWHNALHGNQFFDTFFNHSGGNRTLMGSLLYQSEPCFQEVDLSPCSVLAACRANHS